MYFFECDDLLCGSVDRLPHDSIGALPLELEELVLARDVLFELRLLIAIHFCYLYK